MTSKHIDHLSKRIHLKGIAEKFRLKAASLGEFQMFRVTRGCSLYVLVREKRRNSEFKMKTRCLELRLP